MVLIIIMISHYQFLPINVSILPLKNKYGAWVKSLVISFSHWYPLIVGVVDLLHELMWSSWPLSRVFKCNRDNFTTIQHDALDKYPTMHHFVIEMCTHVHNSITKRCIVGYGTGASRDLCNRCVVAAITMESTMPHTWNTQYIKQT